MFRLTLPLKSGNCTYDDINRTLFNIHNRIICFIHRFTDITVICNYNIKIIITFVSVRTVSKRTKQDNFQRINLIYEATCQFLNIVSIFTVFDYSHAFNPCHDSAPSF